jgi:hypothetical protein
MAVAVLERVSTNRPILILHVSVRCGCVMGWQYQPVGEHSPRCSNSQISRPTTSPWAQLGASARGPRRGALDGIAGLKLTGCAAAADSAD